MFNNLVSSGEKKKHPFWNPRTIAIAVIIHAILIGGAVYVSAKGKEKEKKEEKKSWSLM